MWSIFYLLPCATCPTMDPGGTCSKLMLEDVASLLHTSMAAWHTASTQVPTVHITRVLAGCGAFRQATPPAGCRFCELHWIWAWACIMGAYF